MKKLLKIYNIPSPVNNISKEFQKTVTNTTVLIPLINDPYLGNFEIYQISQFSGTKINKTKYQYQKTPEIS